MVIASKWRIVSDFIETPIIAKDTLNHLTDNGKLFVRTIIIKRLILMFSLLGWIVEDPNVDPSLKVQGVSPATW